VDEPNGQLVVWQVRGRSAEPGAAVPAGMPVPLLPAASSAENVDRIDREAELEIRHLHARLGWRLTHPWKRLLEIQDLRMDRIEEIGRRQAAPDDAAPGSSGS